MADIAVVAASVKPYENATIERGIAGETLAAGKSVYRSSENQIMLANNGAQSTGRAVGIALNAASRKQPVDYQTGGDIDLGVDLDVGMLLLVSGTNGGIAPHADIISGDYPCTLGAALEDRKMRMSIEYWPEPAE